MSSDNHQDKINKAIEVLRNGGTILYPTDTIWGIGCDAKNEAAVEKIFKLKQREESKSLIVLVDNANRIERHVKEVPDAAWDIIDYANKPTTLILDDAHHLAKNAIAEDGSIGMRVCAQPLIQNLIRRFGRPIVSTSANVSGEKSPSHFMEISATIKSGVDYILDIPELYESKSAASSIIKIGRNSDVSIIRE